jgi:hypothetical protein
LPAYSNIVMFKYLKLRERSGVLPVPIYFVKKQNNKGVV